MESMPGPVIASPPQADEAISSHYKFTENCCKTFGINRLIKAGVSGNITVLIVAINKAPRAVLCPVQPFLEVLLCP